MFVNFKTSKYQSEIESLQAAVSEEKKLKNDFVLLLLQDRKKLATIYLDEKQRSDELARLLLDEKRKMGKISSELEEESKRSLAMESEVEGYIRQLASQREETKKILKEENLKRYLPYNEQRKLRIFRDFFRRNACCSFVSLYCILPTPVLCMAFVPFRLICSLKAIWRLLFRKR